MKIVALHIILILSVSNCLFAQVSGYVFEDKNNNLEFDEKIDRPLDNILVSNGKDIVKTNKKGLFTIELLASNPIFLIKPKGYLSPINQDGVLTFFVNPKDIALGKPIYFPLFKHKEDAAVKAVILGDPQVDVMDDVHHVGKLVTEELADKDFDFIIPVGDLTFDNFKMFRPLSKTLGLVNKPVFYTIGNHDIALNKKYDNADNAFERHFGPSYYAFEFGNELFLVLNNVYPQESNKYVGRISKQQYAFVQNLLCHKKGIEKLTVFMHIPLEQMEDCSFFLSQFNQVNFFFIVVGHTHTQYQRYFERNKKEAAYELVAGAVCGAWWQGPHNLEGIPFALMHDGTEKGYWFAHFYDTKVQYQYKVSGSPQSKQMHIWVPESKEWSTELNALNTPYIYANVYAADDATQVTISFDNGRSWLPMEQTQEVDPYLKRLKFLQDKGRFNSLSISKIPSLTVNSKHLWRLAIPQSLKKGTYLIAVKAVNETLGLQVTNYKVFWNE